MDDADLIGVDIGGTKTHILVRYCDGGERDWVTPTVGWRPVEQRRDARALLDLIAAEASLTSSTVVGIGAHGCDTRPQCEEFAQALSHHSPATFAVVNDAELLVPAAGLSSGIGLIAGTGSIVVGQDDSGGLLVVGGWGWLLGDPGSGPAIVREAAKQLLAAADSGDAPDRLSELLCAAYEVDTPLQLAYDLTATRSITHWGNRAPVVFDAAKEGSTLARDLLRTQVDELVAHVSLIRRRGAQGEHVVLGGGVIAGQAGFAQALADRVAEQTGLHTVILRANPVQGALALAARQRAGQHAPHTSITPPDAGTVPSNPKGSRS